MRHNEFYWNIPFCVRSSDFVSLFKRHEVCNLVSDLGSNKPFGPAESSGNFAYADIQQNADENFPYRLGSGRSAFYQSYYLKGIGRTPLAANWANENDAYHATGHLSASAGVRELLISKWFQGRGEAHRIVGCEGLLLKDLDESLHALLNRWAGSGHFPRCDELLQSISVKHSGFVRASNIMWLVQNWLVLPKSSYVSHLFQALNYACNPEMSFRNKSAVELATLCVEAYHRGLDNFGKFFSLGVHWGSTHNNFTLDGRFLDLELPLLIGQPCLGIASQVGSKSCAARISDLRIGTEILSYVRQIRLFMESFCRSLRSFLDTRKLHSIEREFIAHFLEQVAIERDGSPVFCDELLNAWIYELFSSQLGSSSESTHDLNHLIPLLIDWYLYGKDADIDERITFRKIEIDFPLVEPGNKQAILMPESLDFSVSNVCEDVWKVNKAITDCDNLVSVDSIFDTIRSLNF